jgi:hypothetical protein
MRCNYKLYSAGIGWWLSPWGNFVTWNMWWCLGTFLTVTRGWGLPMVFSDRDQGAMHRMAPNYRELFHSESNSYQRCHRWGNVEGKVAAGFRFLEKPQSRILKKGCSAFPRRRDVPFYSYLSSKQGTSQITCPNVLESEDDKNGM